ncbi:3-aminobutyryl-CoA aminotransferase [Stieleria neptunia]|uniref:3-aminobutyryl-CoA aminotransferase n=1 Tax=Stieleria neptunia TaxID=2527979 RepID=A0A518HT77_9BACT|nr:glutamate-1-semialdehyde 2,1-aminomutase [Stieleria neptunia]QDV44011.1 3-aminobutyryl-CoA aminotransferase [Stieleria neptunia]
MEFSKSRAMQRRVHQVIPGGCHTYAKGDDQFPYLAPGFISRGHGCHVWDVDENEYIEYGMGCRAVSLGHGFEPIVQAAASEMQHGVNFTRPAAIELECAEELLGMIHGAEQCKFAKDGSTVTTAALKLARAATGRDRVALCRDHPFFAIHDWFIGTTSINAGIPKAVQDLSLTFRYNDPESLEHLFRRYPDQIACVILEPAKHEDPQDHFLHRVQEICQRHGAVFVLDEMITGFRWDNGGAQKTYDIVPDLSTFGKALANGFSLSALVGKRKWMEPCGLFHDQQRVFALSTTHGAETHALAAGIATMRFYQQNPVIEVLHRQGARLAEGIRRVIVEQGVEGSVEVLGKPCNLVFATRDREGKPSQGFRSLLMQELIRNGVLGPSLVISYSHSDQDVDQTIEAFRAATAVYRQALDEGYQRYLVGPATQVVYRDFNAPAYQGVDQG